jgi:hypothetical protein
VAVIDGTRQRLRVDAGRIDRETSRIDRAIVCISLDAVCIDRESAAVEIDEGCIDGVNAASVLDAAGIDQIRQRRCFDARCIEATPFMMCGLNDRKTMASCVHGR